MTKQILDVEDFAASALDALSSHICVIDKNSLIVAVNRAWRNFTVQNPPVSNRAGIGADYLEICRNASGPGSDDARKFSLGVEWNILVTRPPNTDGSWGTSRRWRTGSEAR
jgi:hypothetical protein